MLQARDHPRTPKRDALALEEAFLSFNRASESLTQAYGVLEERVGRLTAELAQANEANVRQAEENARLCARLTLLLEALPAGVVVIDSTDRVCEANGAAASLLGAELAGQTWSAVTTRHFAHVDGADVVLQNGRRLALSRRELPDHTGCIVLLSDDAEARAVRELLDRHARLSALGEMAARLAHQIRTPLAAALLYVSHLTRPAVVPRDQQRFAEQAVARLKDLEHTVQEMLAFARGGGQAAERLRVGSVLAEAVQMLEPELQPQLTLQVECDADDIAVTGSRTALAGAMVNLVVNAQQALQGAGLVRLVAHEHPRGGVLISVSDNGPGIAPENRQRVFEPFFTLRKGGTGLGLAIVKSIIEAHDGLIELRESDLGGACFEIWLPPANRT
ncbi:MAG TPA: ATP-binding protein [Steroidobacteraceae bacterium]|nr:ATP-binding protein [Steroidobacteraceae bacterium]